MVANNKTNEAEAVKKLVWMLAWALFVLGGAGFGVLFTLMLTANAEQDVSNAEQDAQLGGMVSQTQFSQMFAQAQTSNNNSHNIILGAVAANTSKTETNSTQIAQVNSNVAKVDSKVSKILGIIEMLIRDKDEDND